jgi:N-acetylglucosamine kinase
MALAYIVGIDGGQTSTKCALITLDGRVVAQGSGGGLIHLAAQGSRERFMQSLREALSSAWSTAGLQPQPVLAIGLGLTGVDSPDSPEAHKVQELLPEVVDAHVIAVQSDAYAALIGAHGGQPGLIAIAGTGSVVMGVDAHGHTERAGGWGWLLGDEGSAMWIGRAGLSAALHAFDGVGEWTLLEQMMPDHFGIVSLNDVKRRVYDSGFGSRGFAALAQVVSRAAHANDAVALRIVAQAATDLTAQVMAVHRRLALPADAPVAPIGGAFEHVHGLQAGFVAALREANEQANVVSAQHPPVIGAALMALKLCGVTREYPPASPSAPTR